jgi:hypothetical protein
VCRLGVMFYGRLRSPLPVAGCSERREGTDGRRGAPPPPPLEFRPCCRTPATICTVSSASLPLPSANSPFPFPRNHPRQLSGLTCLPSSQRGQRKAVEEELDSSLILPDICNTASLQCHERELCGAQDLCRGDAIGS